VALVSLCLIGCGDRQSEVFAACRMESLRVFVSVSDATVAYGQSADFTMLCMQSKGYLVTWETCPTSTGISASDVVTRATCYRKRRFWEADQP